MEAWTEVVALRREASRILPYSAQILGSGHLRSMRNNNVIFI